MACLVVTYDAALIGEESERHLRLVATIQALGPWGRMQPGVWFVQTELDMGAVFDALTSHLDDGHPLLVAQVCGEVRPLWANVLCDSDWLQARIVEGDARRGGD